MHKSLQIMIQSLSLGAFLFLMTQGMLQLWMGIFLIGMGISPFFGRLYCGYICPINTTMKPITFLKGKRNWPHVHLPAWLKTRWVRASFLFLFIAAFVFSLTTGNVLPVLPAFLGLGILLTLFTDEAFFHRHLCPYGTFLSFTSSPSKRRVSIDESRCIGCGICEKVCPANAVHHEGKRYWIESKACLTCMACVRHCPIHAIDYTKRS